VSLGARLLGIIRRPRLTLQEVVSHPQWAPMLVLLTVLMAAAGTLVSSTEVGRVARLDQWERVALAFGQPVDDARYAELQTCSHRGPAVSLASALIFGPGLAAVVSLVAFAWVRRRAPRVSYSQVMAVVVHAGVILALGRLVAAPFVYARETTASATTLGAWFAPLDESSPVARFLGAIDLFTVWWAVVLGIGLAILSGHRARTCVGWVVSIYVGLALVAAAVMAVAA
jgi:hypothetical protein